MAKYTTNLPVNGKFNVTAVFGQKGSLWKNGHKGIDIVSDDKTIYSICDGEVTVVSFDNGGWGRYVSIKPDGFERIRIILCHLKEGSVKVKKGDRVSRTTKIGTMGSTGNSTGVHLHIEMRVDNTAVDLSSYLGIENKIKSALMDTDFKVNENEQKRLLENIINSFDKKDESHKACDDEIESLKKELESTKKELKAAKDTIAAVKKALL